MKISELLVCLWQEWLRKLFRAIERHVLQSLHIMRSRRILEKAVPSWGGVMGGGTVPESRTRA
jgi:hypothetical protein